MKTQFVDKGMPVLIGEMGAMKRLSLTGEPLARHILSRLWFYEYNVAAAKARGMIPVVWDAGGLGNGTMSVFDRKAGVTYDMDLLNAIRSGMGLPKLPGDTSQPQVGLPAKAMKVLAGNTFRAAIHPGGIRADFWARTPGPARVTLLDLRGRPVWSGSFAAKS